MAESEACKAYFSPYAKGFWTSENTVLVECIFPISMRSPFSKGSSLQIMRTRIFVTIIYACGCLSLVPSVHPNQTQVLARTMHVPRTQLFRDCQDNERIAIQNLLLDTILPMLHSAEAATSRRGFNRNYNRRKFFEYWGTFTDILGQNLREIINNQLMRTVDEVVRTPGGRIGIYCHGEQLEEYCNSNPHWIMYLDRMYKEIVLVCFTVVHALGRY